MEASRKFAWTWKVKMDCLDAYIALHADPWPEMMAEHSRAGIRNYSIFQEGNLFFYCFECDDVDKAFAIIAESEVCNRWNALTSRMVEGSFDMREAEPIRPMREVFYLK
ncbi:L-rhamnose mutarotase [Cohnella herbarum]|uniref:L-rhamnose mutarotase n=1 Tax=Cohnella herbarum TaxID=2728023 RepID=A0A7Z2ZPY3_9BACL|nr:L-rhamnose mutarotase [Cohnella herbarum]QJD86452.1 L-rhamnose mutarotase [Cohnella herbarum]